MLVFITFDSLELNISRSSFITTIVYHLIVYYHPESPMLLTVVQNHIHKEILSHHPLKAQI